MGNARLLLADCQTIMEHMPGWQQGANPNPVRRAPVLPCGSRCYVSSALLQRSWCTCVDQGRTSGSNLVIVVLCSCLLGAAGQPRPVPAPGGHPAQQGHQQGDAGGRAQDERDLPRQLRAVQAHVAHAQGDSCTGAVSSRSAA